MSKPIRLFYSALSGRIYASNKYKTENGNTVITGEKHDVTNDVGHIINTYDLEFTRKPNDQ